MRLLLISQLFTSVLWCQDVAASCKVTFRVIDDRGVTQPAYTVKSFIYDGVDYANRFEGQRGVVPCQLRAYSFELRRTNAATAYLSAVSMLSGHIFITRPETWVTLLKPLGAILSDDGTRGGVASIATTPGYVWQGFVKGMPQAPLWLRMTSLHFPETVYGNIEAAIDPSGEFRVYVPFHLGPYALSITDHNGRILYFGLVRPENRIANERLELSLPATTPESVPIR